MDLNDEKLKQLSLQVSDALRARGFRLITAESCTGGWLAKLMTDLPGSSDIFDCAYVCYSNRSKADMLGVDEQLLDQFGAVSEQAVIALCEGALARSTANLAVAISGIAGPGGGSDEKPVGTVWLATASRTSVIKAQRMQFSGDREAIRRQAVSKALMLIAENLRSG